MLFETVVVVVSYLILAITHFVQVMLFETVVVVVSYLILAITHFVQVMLFETVCCCGAVNLILMTMFSACPVKRNCSCHCCHICFSVILMS